MTSAHDDLIRRYAEGPTLIRKALAQVPAEAVKWRPAPGKWSVHEIIIHCADSETNAHMRVRYLLAEKDPVIVGYDQDAWAKILDYHSLPLEPALVTIEAVRANTLPLLRTLTEDAWKRTGRHTEHKEPFGVEEWMKAYGEHLEVHDRQIRRNIAAFTNR
jgi:hypothetical protein